MRKFKFELASDCKSALFRFDASCRIVMMIVELSSVVREIALVKKECISFLITVKVDVHQDEVK